MEEGKVGDVGGFGKGDTSSILATWWTFKMSLVLIFYS